MPGDDAVEASASRIHLVTGRRYKKPAASPRVGVEARTHVSLHHHQPNSCTRSTPSELGKQASLKRSSRHRCIPVFGSKLVSLSLFVKQGAHVTLTAGPRVIHMHRITEPKRGSAACPSVCPSALNPTHPTNQPHPPPHTHPHTMSHRSHARVHRA